MKKIIFILVFLLLIPLNVFALSITDVEVIGDYQGTIGKEFALDYNIMFDEIKKDDPNSYGLVLIGFELEMDSNIFQINNIESSLSTEYYIDTNNPNKIYILSAINDKTNYTTCYDNVTYCEDYKAKITFGIKNTEEVKSDIKINNIIAAAVKISEENEEDLKIYELREDINKTNSIVINKNTDTYQEIKRLEPSNSKEMNAENILNDVKTSDKKDNLLSSNNFIKSLTITNYDIEFDKYKTNYNLDLKNDDNSIEVNVELDNSFAKYKIIGNDDLKSNDYKVLIEVTAQNGDIETYTINMLKKDVNNEITTTKKVKKENEYKLNKKYILYFIIGLSLFIIIIIIVIINYIINKKKVDNLFRN